MPTTERPAVADRRISWALLIPLVFFAGQGAFSFQSEGTAVGGFAPGGVVQRSQGVFGYTLAGLSYSIVLWLISTRMKEISSFALRFKAFTALGALCVASALWSQSPLHSAIFGSCYLVGTLFAFYLIARFDPEEIMSLTMRLGVVVSVLGILMVAFFPQYGLTHGEARIGVGWVGIFQNRTGAARCLVFLLSPGLVRGGGGSKAGRIGYVLLLGTMVAMAHAVSAILVLFLFVAFMAAMRVGRRFDRRLFLVAAILGSAGIALAVYIGVEYGAAILEALGRNPTLTGRTEIWRALADSILKRPLLGYGFSAFWQGLKGESARIIYAVHWTFGYAHNGYLDILLQLGIAGLSLFVMTLVQAIRNAWICYRFDRSGRYDWYIGILVIAVFYNLDEATVVWPNDLLSILYIVACCGLAIAAEQCGKLHLEQSASHEKHLSFA